MGDHGNRIAEQEILVVPPPGIGPPFAPSPGNRGIKVVLAIDLPKGEYPAKCEYYIDGLLKPQHATGCDRWQALFLAIYAMRRFLKNQEENGCTFELYEEGCESKGHPSGNKVSLVSLFQFPDLVTSE